MNPNATSAGFASSYGGPFGYNNPIAMQTPQPLQLPQLSSTYAQNNSASHTPSPTPFSTGSNNLDQSSPSLPSLTSLSSHSPMSGSSDPSGSDGTGSAAASATRYAYLRPSLWHDGNLKTLFSDDNHLVISTLYVDNLAKSMFLDHAARNQLLDFVKVSISFKLSNILDRYF